MATAPAFAATPLTFAALASATLDASLTAPTNVATVATGVATGTKIEQITAQAVGTTVLGVLNLFLHDGSTYHLFDQVLVPAVTSSTTSRAWQTSRLYPNLLLPTTSWSLRFTVTIAGLQSMIKVSAYGGSF